MINWTIEKVTGRPAPVADIIKPIGKLAGKLRASQEYHLGRASQADEAAKALKAQASAARNEASQADTIAQKIENLIGA